MIKYIKNLQLVVWGLIVILISSTCSDDLGEHYTIISNVNLIKVSSMEMEPNQNIILKNNRIHKIISSDELTISEKDKVIDGEGLFAIPGLWDAHIHLSKIKEDALPILVANGVTSVRDMGSSYSEVQKFRFDIDKGNVIGPHIITSGPMIEAPETLQRLKDKKTYEDYISQRVFIDDTLYAIKVVDSLKSLGVDFIKIREYKSLDIYRAIANAAKKNNLDFVGHPPFSMDVVEAANTLNMTTWEHASYPFPLPKDSLERNNILDAIKTNNLAITPTMVAWEIQLKSPEIYKEYLKDSLSENFLISKYHQKELTLSLQNKKAKSEEALKGWNYFFNQTAKDMKTFSDAGIIILAGSDQSANELIPGYSLHDELELMQNAIGMSPAKILQNATYIASRVFNQETDYGTLEEGKIANILLLSKNPLDDIANTRKIKYVINHGLILDSTKISSLLNGHSLEENPIDRKDKKTLTQ